MQYALHDCMYRQAPLTIMTCCSNQVTTAVQPNIKVPTVVPDPGCNLMLSLHDLWLDS